MKASAQIDMSAALSRLRSMQDLGFLRPAMDGIARELAAKTALTFRGQADPWGRAWQVLRPSTIRARRGGGQGAQILRDTGRLSNSIHAERVGPLTVELGTDAPYAAIHQFGGTTQHEARSIRVRLRKVKNANGKTVNRFAKDSHKRAETKWGEAAAWATTIPARPFLPVRPGGAVDLPPTWMADIHARLVRAVGEVGR